MTQHTIETREGLPTEMQALLRDYPRETWPENPNFADSIQNWMGAHQMFRQLSNITRSDAEQFLNNDLDRDVYVGRLGHFGTLLVRNLHGHHTWEDRSFFPELAAADTRFDHGLQMLESDHVAMDRLLDDLTRHGNRLIQLSQLDPDQVLPEAGQIHDQACQIERFLERHLTDEEDLVVPILLHHKLRG